MNNEKIAYVPTPIPLQEITKEAACDFAEWAEENYFRFGNTNRWSLTPDTDNPVYTTAELYDGPYQDYLDNLKKENV